MSSFEIQKVNPKLLKSIRQRVLLPHKTVEECFIEGEEDPNSLHFAVLNGEDIIGCASFVSQDCEFNEITNSYRLRQMGIEPNFQGQGLGKLLLRVGVLELQDNGVKYLWCNARRVAYQFYLNLGFEYLSDEFDIAKIGPHKVMGRSL